LGDIHTQFFYDIPRSTSVPVESQVKKHILRDALSILPAMTKVPPWIKMLDEPLNIEAQKRRDLDSEEKKEGSSSCQLGGESRAWLVTDRKWE
jgi:hypothetical protein